MPPLLVLTKDRFTIDKLTDSTEAKAASHLCASFSLGGSNIWRERGLARWRDDFHARRFQGPQCADRLVWVADFFEGLPAPDPDLFPLEAKAQAGSVIQKAYHNLAVGPEQVQRNFAAYGLLDDQVKFLKGWFKDTLPTAPIGTLSLIRLDGDFYESTRDGLDSLFDSLSIGGFVIIDDYGEDSWTYCRKAVDEFRLERQIADPLIAVDSRCSYWQRSS